MNPATMNEQAPVLFKADFQLGNGGDFVIEVHRQWDPSGADRFYNLVKNGFFDDCRFFRVVPGFMVQFGMNGDPAVTAAWTKAPIKDEPVVQGNKRGFVSFAKPSAPNMRTTQVFINFGDNSGLDRQGFSAFGEVVSGMDNVDKINSEYGEMPQQGQISNSGNAYLTKSFPKLDYVKKAMIVK